jgi:molecular chaperone HscB
VNLQDNDFQLFSLVQQFAQDRSVIDAQWKDLQRQAHPDKFSMQDAAAKRSAMQWSVRINEAYQRLKDPLRRAAYLCELHGEPVNAENNTTMPGEFLIQQMEWREALDEATSLSDLDGIGTQVVEVRRQALQKCEQLLDQDKNFAQAAQQVRALMFIERFDSDVEARRYQMDTADK